MSFGHVLAVMRDPPVLEHEDAVREIENAVVVRDDDAGAVFGHRDFAQEVHHPAARRGVERGGGFVAHHQPRFVDQRARNRHALLQAARAVGSTPAQVIMHGVLPQVLPQMADVTIYRWEFNFRASVVVGVVGAGGIGFELIAALRTLKYEEVSAILLVILATVTVVDALGGLLRKRFA